MIRNVCRNTAVENGANNNNNNYEIKIGETVYAITHEYGSTDMLDLVTDYLAEKTATDKSAKAA